MSIENKNNKEPLVWSTRAKRLAAGTALAVAGGGVAGAAYLASEQGPEMHGHKIVVVDKGDTVDQIVNVHVEGGASHTGAVRAEVLNDPDNADVFENGQLDPGEELEVPEKVTQ